MRRLCRSFMHESAAPLFVLLAVALASCAPSVPPPSEAVARARMTGMTPRQVASCMGKPGTRFTEHGVTAWSYDTPGAGGRYYAPMRGDLTNGKFGYTPFDGSPGFAEFDPEPGAFRQDLSSPPQAACTVEVDFDPGRVGAVSYRARKHEGKLYAEKCEEITAGCVR